MLGPCRTLFGPGSPSRFRRLSARRLAQSAAATVPAMLAWHVPSGLCPQTVVSRAVSCSVSASSLAQSGITVLVSRIQVVKPIAAPSATQVSLWLTRLPPRRIWNSAAHVPDPCSIEATHQAEPGARNVFAARGRRELSRRDVTCHLRLGHIGLLLHDRANTT